MLTPKIIKKVTKGNWLILPKSENQKLSGASFNSRKIKKEQIFFCWKGEYSDGHLYLNQLKNSSIKLIIVEKIVSIKIEIAILKVTNSLKALHQLASYIAESCHIPIIAITGSSGKTTAKCWLATVLSEKYRILTNYKNFNNQIGCPITLLSLTNEQLIILEMGTSSPGELPFLISIVKPDYAILLNVGLAHIKYFINLEKTYQEKISIFNSPNLKKGFYATNLKPIPNKNLIRYGDKSQYSCEILETNLQQSSSSCFIKSKNLQTKIDIPVFGFHLKETIAMLLAVAAEFEIESTKLIKGLQNIKPVSNRMQIKTLTKNRFLINDSYNANPNSVINLLKSMTFCKNYKKIAVIGLLAELDNELTTTIEYFQKNIPSSIDKIYFTDEKGEIIANNLSKLPSIKFIKDRAALLSRVKLEFTANSILAFKASRSAKFDELFVNFE